MHHLLMHNHHTVTFIVAIQNLSFDISAGAKEGEIDKTIRALLNETEKVRKSKVYTY